MSDEPHNPPPPSESSAEPGDPLADSAKPEASARNPAKPAEAAPGAGRPAKRKRGWKRRAIAASFGIGMALLAVEVGVRVTWGTLVTQHEVPLAEGLDLESAFFKEVLYSPVADLREREATNAEQHHQYRADPLRGFRLIPEHTSKDLIVDGQPDLGWFTVVTDSLGMRNAQRPAPSPDTLKVLVVGDSMTFGKGVEGADTFSSRLEPLLAEQLGRPVRVYNGGVSSYGQVEEIAALRELVPQLEPDVVLLAFTVANDLTDNLRWQQGVSPLVPDDEVAPYLSSLLLDNPLAWWSRTYRLLAWRFGRHLIRYRLMSQPELLDRAASLLDEAREASGDAAFGVVIAPPQFEVEGYWAESLLAATAIHEGLASRLTERKIPYRDPLPALKDRASEGLYIPIDLHFTTQGHQAFAEAIAPFVAELAGK